MKRSEALIGGIALYVAMAGAAMIAREATAKSWDRVADRPPPKDPASSDTGYRDALLWALLSGAAAGLARVFVQRAAAARGVSQARIKANLKR